jgi:hypothetical protein
MGAFLVQMSAAHLAGRVPGANAGSQVRSSVRQLRADARGHRPTDTVLCQSACNDAASTGQYSPSSLSGGRLTVHAQTAADLRRLAPRPGQPETVHWPRGWRGPNDSLLKWPSWSKRPGRKSGRRSRCAARWRLLFTPTVVHREPTVRGFVRGPLKPSSYGGLGQLCRTQFPSSGRLALLNFFGSLAGATPCRSRRQVR